jgi:hypothetical protein
MSAVVNKRGVGDMSIYSIGLDQGLLAGQVATAYRQLGSVRKLFKAAVCRSARLTG